ncbi:hypothetical protein EMCRGX_G023432, partial [Ephydatia muelleri]
CFACIRLCSSISRNPQAQGPKCSELGAWFLPQNAEDVITSPLWQRAASLTNGKFRQRQQENNERKVKNSVALAREGLLGKACQALTSAGIAPNNNETLELIQSKHPKGPPPIPPAPSSPPIPILSKDFNIAMVLRSFPKSTACGPSGLRIQHLLDTAEVPLQFPISSSLRDIVNLLASGKVPVSVSRHLAEGSLTALVKGKPGFPPDIRPIAVGEALRRLTGKCLCAVLKSKASEFFAPFQFGVACPAGAEKVIHGLRHCIEEHWEEEDFVVLKIDMCNAFNLVSRQALLDECAFHFPDLLPWASWCYGQQPLLQHPLGTLTSELVSAIATDEDTAKLLFHAWYLDDGVVAGPKQSVLHALAIIQELGPPLGLVINPSKCHHALTCKHGGDVVNRHNRLRDVFAESCRRACIGVQVEAGSGLGRDEHHTWPADVLATNWMLGKPAAFDFAVTSPLNSSTLHEASVTAGSAAHATEARKHQANDVKCAELGWVSIPVVVETYGCWGTEAKWALSQLASRLAMRLNSPKSTTTASLYGRLSITLVRANKVLSGLIQAQHFHILLESSSPANRARLLSVAAPHASSWLSVVPSPGLGLHLESNEFQMAIRWWLGLDTSGRSMCPFCPDTALDPLGHHVVTCRHGGDVVIRHNRLRDEVFDLCRRAHLSVSVERGHGLTRDLAHTRPADILIAGWNRGKPAALDLTITSPLCSVILGESCYQAGAAALAAETRKLHTNGPKCQELGWSCIPLAVETYGNWGKQTHDTFSRLASFL